jgi:hypothetical protein
MRNCASYDLYLPNTPDVVDKKFATDDWDEEISQQGSVIGFPENER